jgi:hypothetical protein
LLQGQIHFFQNTHFLGKGDAIFIKSAFFAVLIEVHTLYEEQRPAYGCRADDDDDDDDTYIM